MITNDKYRYSSAVSQSKLKKLLIGLGEYKKKQEDKVYFNLGDGVDILLTESKEVYDSVFYVSHLTKLPSDNLIKVVEYYRDHGDILEAFSSVYDNNWSDKVKLKKWDEECQDYYNEIIAVGGRKIISAEQHQLILDIVKSLLTSYNTKEYFEEEARSQLAIYFEYEGIECKALLDRLNINHENKTLQPIDIKTTGDSTLSFKYTAKKFRYDIQASFYTKAVESYRDILYPGYTILPFIFIVESTKYVGQPLIYTCSKEDLIVGEYGLDVIQDTSLGHTAKSVKGFRDALEIYKWYEKNGYEVDKSIMENEGNLPLNLWYE